jgi:hypothetical protein
MTRWGLLAPFPRVKPELKTPLSSVNSIPSASSVALIAANPLAIAVPDISAPISKRSTV